MIICGANSIDYNEASSMAHGLLCVALTLVLKSIQQVIISDILPQGLKIKEVTELLKMECSKLTSRVFYMEPDSD